MFRYCVTVAVLCAAAPAADTALVDRVGNTAFVQLEAPSFARLSPRQQTLAYWLTQASIAIDPIVYDQNSRFGLRQKRLLEALVPAGGPKITGFAKLFWANRGNHNDMTAQKFLPGFTFEELQSAAKAALSRNAFRGTPYGTPAIRNEAELNRELSELRPSLFDPDFEPTITAKSPRGNLDILQASANNFYSNLTLADLQGFQEQHPLNSRLVKAKDGKLVEEVYRAGTPDGKVPPGRYAPFLKKANECLEKARAFAEPGQDKVLASLIRYYQTGNFRDWIEFGIGWVGNNQTVDFANGFIEVYRDARGAKGTSQSFVTITDLDLTGKMVTIARNAQYFEDRAPWLGQYKKQGVNPPLAKAVETLIETGDFHVSTVGDNLPNENEIREKYGTKSLMFTGSSRTLQRASGTSALDEFAASPQDAALLKKYGEEAGGMMTALHEIIGHGSGKLNPKLTAGSEPLLKEYYSTLEEARADLMALWNIFDPKLQELKLISSPEVGRAMYLNAAMAALTQLRRIPRGETIEEDHQRDRQLIVRYIQEKTGAIRQFERGGKTYIEVTDYKKMREGAGMLLAELMRIKAEGDYAAIKALIDRYGVHFDVKLRDQVVARYKKLDLPTYWAGLNAELTLQGGKVELTYPRDYVKQQMGYASMWK
jgi:dipeptidyl-peptidase III